MNKLKITYFNNQLSIKINILFLVYHYFCILLSNVFFSKYSEKINELSRELEVYGYTKLPKIFASDEVLEIRKKIDIQIQKKRKNNTELSHIFTPIDSPILECGIDINKILFNVNLRQVIKKYYRSNFRFKWLDCYRSYVVNDTQSSWLWHFDNHPYGVLKGILLLSDQDENTGAMKIYDKKRSKRLKLSGYDGNREHTRLSHIDHKCDEINIEKKPIFFNGEAGDIFLFEANNLHKANSPKNGIRDAATFLILPSINNISEPLGVDSLKAIESNPGGWPSRPWK